MKISDSLSAPAVGCHEERTRDAVARLVLESGPLTAAALAARLHLSAAAVRRHLEALVGDGDFVEVQPRGGRYSPRGRGRPARAYALTDAGRARFGHAYDDLAVTALRYLVNTGGTAAVIDFAEHRALELVETITARTPEASATTADKTRVAAMVLSEQGYAADIEDLPSGVQLCQHHCPVAHVAAEFPQLCEAETRALAGALGTYVQRLATIAHGDGVCTTYIPNTASAPGRNP